MPMTERFYSVNGQMMGYESGGVKKDFLTDHLGSITAEIDQNQNRTFETRYSAYGRNNWSTGTGCGFGWVGSYGYRETGLFHMSHYVRARHYSYITGNWSTVDPVWPDESAYGYVSGQPLFWIDPTGWQKGGGGGRGGSGTIPRTTPPNTSKPPAGFPKGTGNGNGTGVGPKPGVGPRPGAGGSPPVPGGNPGPSEGEAAIICGMFNGSPISCLAYICMNSGSTPKPKPKLQPWVTYEECAEAAIDYGKACKADVFPSLTPKGFIGPMDCKGLQREVDRHNTDCIGKRWWVIGNCDAAPPPGWVPKEKNHLMAVCQQVQRLLNNIEEGRKRGCKITPPHDLQASIHRCRMEGLMK